MRTEDITEERHHILQTPRNTTFHEITMTDKSHTVIPQEVSMSSLSSTSGLSVDGTIQDQ